MKRITSIFALTLALAVPASAHAYGYAFQWAACSASGCTAFPLYGFNSQAYAGVVNPVTRSGVGLYTVTMTVVGGPGGNVQVSAYGSVGAACSVRSWRSLGTTETVDVRCHNTAGAPVDSSFEVLYQDHSGPFENPYGEAAYLWTRDLAGTVSPQYSFNSTGATNSVTRTGTGLYTVTVPGLTDANASVLVTPYNTTHRCRVRASRADTARTTLDVVCNTAAGAAVDAQFSLSVTTGGIPVRIGDRYGSNYGAWATVNADGSLPVGACGNVRTGLCDLSARRTATGRDVVHLPDLYPVFSGAWVNAYGASDAACVVRNWNSGTSGGVDVNVDCYRGGALADSAFSFVYATRETPLI